MQRSRDYEKCVAPHCKYFFKHPAIKPTNSPGSSNLKMTDVQMACSSSYVLACS